MPICLLMSKKPPPMSISPLQAWILAIRPRTLPAAAAPVLVGTAAAIADRQFVFIAAVASGIVAFLLQIGVNLANDYFDHKKGFDTADRLGPLRVTQSGLLQPASVKKAMIMVLCAAGVIGGVLIFVAGWPVLVIGLSCILAALAYSGGPYPLASHGLGDLFVFIFFGLVAVCGTYFVQAGKFTVQVVQFSIPIGFLITAILVVNNLRDIPTDRKTGKNTLAVKLGQQGTRMEYLALIVGAYILPAAWFLSGKFPIWILLPLLSLPMAAVLIKRFRVADGAALNPVLGGTASLSLAYSLLLAFGIVLL
jgi:1,4-dihydroxy-2-naphthoate octaprenyltransferase